MAWPVGLFLKVYTHAVATKYNTNGAFMRQKVIMSIVEALQEELEKKTAVLEQYKNLVEGTSDWLWETDANWIYTYVNPKVRDLLGYAPLEVIGKTIFAFMSEDEERTVAGIFDGISAKELPVTSLFTTCIHKDGHSVSIEMSAVPIFDRLEKLCGYRGVNRGITQDRLPPDVKDGKDNEKAKSEALRSQKLESLGVLAGGIAHDFNNYLTGILGNISLAKYALKKNDVEKAVGRLAEAEKAVEMSQGLTRQLLVFSRGGSSGKEIIDIGGVIRKSAEFALSGSKARCRFAIASNLQYVNVDEGQISQVINNIVLNAEQSMPDGGAIKLTAENITLEEGNHDCIKPGRYVKVSIEDSGCGIPETNLISVFEPYFTTKGKGSGLGLATAYAIVKNHGGEITLESKLGIGSTFNIYIPSAENLSAGNYNETDISVPVGAKVLVLDDEEIIRDVLNEILTTLGYSVAFAYEGAGAVELYCAAAAAGAPFDMVIMDLTIPGGMGGLEAVKKLIAIDPKVKAIVSSGYSGDPIMTNYSAYGFRGVISKPYRIGDVNRVIKSVLAAG